MSGMVVPDSWRRGMVVRRLLFHSGLGVTNCSKRGAVTWGFKVIIFGGEVIHKLTCSFMQVKVGKVQFLHKVIHTPVISLL